MDVKHSIKKSSPIYIVIYIWICSLIINSFVGGIFEVFDLNDIFFVDKTQNDDFGIFKIIDIVFISPLIETFIFQFLLFRFLLLFSFFQKNKIYIVIISAIIFAASHYNSLTRIIITFLMGFLFTAIFILREKNKGFWIVSIAHGIWNATVVIIKLVEQSR